MSTTSDQDIEELEQTSSAYRPSSLGALVAETRFSRRELKVMYRNFKQTCPSGTVSLEQFKGLLGQLFPSGSAEPFAALLFASFRPQRPETLSFDEMVRGMSGLARGSLEERVQWIWLLYDGERRGALRPAHLHSVVSAVYALLGPPPPTQAPALPPGEGPEEPSQARLHSQEAFRKLDCDGDGLISRQDFFAVCLSDPTIARSLRAFDDIPITA